MSMVKNYDRQRRVAENFKFFMCTSRFIPTSNRLHVVRDALDKCKNNKIEIEIRQTNDGRQTHRHSNNTNDT